MAVNALQREYLDLRGSLFREGILDEQYAELQQLQDESSPDFVEEAMGIFFRDAARLLTEIRMVLDQPVVDFQRVDAHVHQLKGSSASIGAQRVKNLCLLFRNFCEEKNREKCISCFEHLNNEYILVKSMIERLFMLQHQILQAGGRIP